MSPMTNGKADGQGRRQAVCDSQSCNLRTEEDRVVKGKGLYDIDRQAKRIAAIRNAAERKGVPLFINARTDVFLGNSGDVDEALERAQAYASAGASGFFIPGLTAASHIRRIA